MQYFGAISLHYIRRKANISEVGISKALLLTQNNAFCEKKHVLSIFKVNCPFNCEWCTGVHTPLLVGRLLCLIQKAPTAPRSLWCRFTSVDPVFEVTECAAEATLHALPEPTAPH